MSEFACDNSGNRVGAGVQSINPVAASGQTVATGTAGDDKTFTVVGGARYAITGIGTAVLLSITGVTSTAANIEWVAPANTTIVVAIPEGSTTLYFEGDTSSKNVYLQRLAD
jgi:hypothetical protein